MNSSEEKRSIRQRIKQRVLGRIYHIWFLRYAAPLFAAEIVAVVIAAVFFSRFVFFEEVVSNTLNASAGNPWRAFLYLLSAFIGTTLFTKFVIIIIVGGGILFFRDINRSIIAYAAVKRDERFSGSR
ncbi:MAG: hypothetical protein AAB518_02795 [Patescibacteria group bacterium]